MTIHKTVPRTCLRCGLPLPELKPCPLCGEPGQLKRIQTPHYHGWVGCPKCKLYLQWQHSDREAVEKWNRRAAG